MNPRVLGLITMLLPYRRIHALSTESLDPFRLHDDHITLRDVRHPGI